MQSFKTVEKFCHHTIAAEESAIESFVPGMKKGWSNFLDSLL